MAGTTEQAWLAVGSLATRMEVPATASVALESALNYNPFNTSALVAAGDAAMATHAYAKALEFYQRALHLVW